MATYDEILGIIPDDPMRGRVLVACLVAADAIRTEDATTPNHAERMKWAGLVLREPKRMAEQMWLSVLAQNKGASLAQIKGAADATIQVAVNAAVDLCALSLPG
jgi:hypothetical protein